MTSAMRARVPGVVLSGRASREKKPCAAISRLVLRASALEQRCVLLPENSPPFGARPGDGALRDASARSDNVSGLPKCVKRDNLSLCTASHLVHAG